MTKEGSSRRRRILSEVQSLDVEALLFEAKVGGRSQRSARDDCLRVIVPDLIRRNVGRLTVESCDQDRADVRVISDAVAKEDAHRRFHYLHAAPASEPLLWLPDILAWAYGAGGDWYRRAANLVSSVTKIDV
jgi:hypothetical protein